MIILPFGLREAEILQLQSVKTSTFALTLCLYQIFFPFLMTVLLASFSPGSSIVYDL